MINNSNHKFKTGINFSYNNLKEFPDSLTYKIKEINTGVFFEYNFNYLETTSLLIGLRIDRNNIIGSIITPRLHLKYNLLKNMTIRTTFGKGYRFPFIFAENISIFSSSRKIVIIKQNNSKPYGLNPEIAWNYGINLTYNFSFKNKDGLISLDLYQTYFKEQIITDFDQSPHEVWFYNLKGNSFSNAIQVQIDYELLKRLDVRLAYKFYEVKTTYISGFKEMPLLSKHRAFINIEYETINRFKFDFTLNYQGRKRIPNTNSNPEYYRFSDYSPSYYTINIHISKLLINDKFELYIGAENLNNFKQSRTILSYEDPFSEYFDASLIWGPIFGRTSYIGFRYKIK